MSQARWRVMSDVLTGMLVVAALAVAVVAFSRRNAASEEATGAGAATRMVLGDSWTGLPSTALAIGDLAAPVQVVVFTDVACPLCALQHLSADSAVREMPDHLRVALRHFPSTSAAYEHAVGANCAARHQKGWEFMGAAFSVPDSLRVRTSIGQLAIVAGVDSAAVVACSREAPASVQVETDVSLGRTLEVVGTPLVIVNGTAYRGFQPADSLMAYARRALAASRTAAR